MAGRGGEQTLLVSSVIITRGSRCALITKLLFSTASHCDSTDCPHTGSAWELTRIFTARKLKCVCSCVCVRVKVKREREILKDSRRPLMQVCRKFSPYERAIERERETERERQGAGGVVAAGYSCHERALSIGPLLPSPDPCYCGDKGPWVTDGCWGVSAVVRSTKCVNHRCRYKELKGCMHGRKKQTPQWVQVWSMYTNTFDSVSRDLST